MSSNSSQSKSNEDSEVMVRQVNLAAAFHDHISCTKISQQSITTTNFGLQTNDSEINDSQNQSIAAELSVAYESDHMYATDNKSMNDNNGLSSNGIVRTNSLFNNCMSEERNQISKLTEMILGQLDLIQHQQEQLLKKDRQLQGLKQDREALCLRLEKMEKRIAVLSAKVAANNNNVINNSNICVNNSINNNSMNSNRNVINSNQNTNNTAETDCDQSGSDTIIEDTNSNVGVFADPTVFSKLYSNTTSIKSCNANTINSTKSTISGNNSNNNSNLNAINTTSETNNCLMSANIKAEPQDSESELSITNTTTATTSTASVRKRGKRQPEVSALLTSNLSLTSISNKKRRKLSDSCVVNTNEMNIKETSSDSLSTFSTTKSTKTYSNVNNVKKKIVKQKCESISRSDKSHGTSSLYCRNSSLTKDMLMTTKPYSIVVNSDYLPIELSLSSNSNDLFDTKTNCSLTESELSEQNDTEMIEVPNWRLHPVSSCYSLEGTENLDDEVFNRRHMKLENDERRRKRWDIQRLREHRYNEKLRTGRYYNSSLSNCFVEKPSDLKEEKKKGSEITSFYPDIKNLQAIEVSDKIPFIAFGHPIPKIPAKHFSLPWNSSELKVQTTKQRNTPQKKTHS